MTSYAYARQAVVSKFEIEKLGARRIKSVTDEAAMDSSLLFLRIFAVADYFSLDTSLMEKVPPVLVDVILDRYLLNIFPQSLVPTTAYIAVLAMLAWFLSGFIWKGLVQVAKSDRTDAVKKTS